jgi:hydroxyacylglutathione hydrolase
MRITILDVPGHTLGHICYYFPDEDVLFVGDTLFNLGCGRLFEGTPLQMYWSLEKIKSLPAETWIYCAHEYTLRNGQFALTIEPENENLKGQLKIYEDLRRQQRPTIPTRLGDQLTTNPFLRASQKSIKSKLGMLERQDSEVFAEIRRRRDVF